MKTNGVKDKNSTARVIVVMTAIGLCAFVLFGSKSPSLTKSRATTEESSDAEGVRSAKALATPQASMTQEPVGANGGIRSAQAAASGASNATSPMGPATGEERASLDTLATILFDESRHSTTKPAEFVNKLVRLGYQPMVARDSNEATGTMVVVRTKNALPGTRYLHAQFFSDEHGQFFPQHISFEFRPSQSMGDVVASLEQRFGKLGRPTTNDGVWMTWKLPNDYSLWIKRLEPADLDGNPYNAYSPADVNTLRVALEKDVPGHEEAEAL